MIVSLVFFMNESKFSHFSKNLSGWVSVIPPVRRSKAVGHGFESIDHRFPLCSVCRWRHFGKVGRIRKPIVGVRELTGTQNRLASHVDFFLREENPVLVASSPIFSCSRAPQIVIQKCIASSPSPAGAPCLGWLRGF